MCITSQLGCRGIGTSSTMNVSGNGDGRKKHSCVWNDGPTRSWRSICCRTAADCKGESTSFVGRSWSVVPGSLRVQPSGVADYEDHRTWVYSRSAIKRCMHAVTPYLQTSVESARRSEDCHACRMGVLKAASRKLSVYVPPGRAFPFLEATFLESSEFDELIL